MKFKILNIGSGFRPMEDAVNFDIVDSPANRARGVFVQGDFNKILPFRDGTFEKVIMDRSLEHVKDIWFTLREVHRVLKSGGEYYFRVPYFKFPTAFSPLTHTYYFTWEGLDSLDNEYDLFVLKFKRLNFHTHSSTTEFLTLPFRWVANAAPYFYERTILSTLFPAVELEYLMVKK